jgi:hypothetical protein
VNVATAEVLARGERVKLGVLVRVGVRDRVRVGVGVRERDFVSERVGVDVPGNDRLTVGVGAMTIRFITTAFEMAPSQLTAMSDRV